jgi:hypothetical protein
VGASRLLKYGIALALSVQLLGCSGSTKTSDPRTSPTPSVSASAQPQVSPTPGAGSQNSGSTGGTTGQSVDADGVPVAEAYKEPHLAMNLKEGVKPQFNNGPTAEELARYRKRLQKKPKTKVRVSSGQNAPVFDTEMVEVNI